MFSLLKKLNFESFAGKGEIAGYENIFLFMQGLLHRQRQLSSFYLHLLSLLQNAFIFDTSKQFFIWYSVEKLPDTQEIRSGLGCIDMK